MLDVESGDGCRSTNTVSQESPSKSSCWRYGLWATVQGGCSLSDSTRQLCSTRWHTCLMSMTGPCMMRACAPVAARPELPVLDHPLNTSGSACLALVSTLPGLVQCNMPVRVTGSYPVTVSVNQLPETEAGSTLAVMVFPCCRYMLAISETNTVVIVVIIIIITPTMLR